MCETERRTARRKPKPRNRRSPLQYGVRDCVRAPISNIDRGVTVGVAHRGQTCTHSYSGSASPHTGHRALSRARPHHAQTHDHERRAVPALCVVPLPLFPAHVRRHACGTLSIGARWCTRTVHGSGVDRNLSTTTALRSRGTSIPPRRSGVEEPIPPRPVRATASPLDLLVQPGAVPGAGHGRTARPFWRWPCERRWAQARPIRRERARGGLDVGESVRSRRSAHEEWWRVAEEARMHSGRRVGNRAQVVAAFEDDDETASSQGAEETGHVEGAGRRQVHTCEDGGHFCNE